MPKSPTSILNSIFSLSCLVVMIFLLLILLLPSFTTIIYIPHKANAQMMLQQQPTNASLLDASDNRSALPWFGANFIDMTLGIAKELGLKESTGVLVTDIIPGGPADKAGIRGGYTLS